jgi:hypothetical protein
MKPHNAPQEFPTVALKQRVDEEKSVEQQTRDLLANLAHKVQKTQGGKETFPVPPRYEVA